MRFLPGHWALGLWKIGVGAVPLLRLGLPNQRSRFVSCVGATLAVARKGSLQKEPIKTSEVWSPKGFPNLARCFILSL